MERYNKHYQELTKESYIKDMGAALGVFLWGIFCAPYYLYKILRSDSSKRKDKVGKIIGKKTEVNSVTFLAAVWATMISVPKVLIVHCRASVPKKTRDIISAIEKPDEYSFFTIFESR